MLDWLKPMQLNQCFLLFRLGNRVEIGVEVVHAVVGLVENFVLSLLVKGGFHLVGGVLLEPRRSRELPEAC